MSKNIYKYKLENIEDIVNSTFFQDFLSKESRESRNGQTIYIAIKDISFNMISKIAWEVTRLKNDLKVVIIFNEPKDVKKLIRGFMNNIHEGNLSTLGTYARDANTLKGQMKNNLLEFRVAKEKYHINAINGYTTIFGLERAVLDKNYKNGYVFWEDYEEYSAQIRNELRIIYNNSENAEEIENLLEYMRRDYSVDEIYYLMLMNIFQVQEYSVEKRDINSLQMSELGLWKQLYDFQKDGVYGLIHRLNNVGYALLGDSVGLGKTYQALAVIQYYQEKRSVKTLVLSPVKLFDNWNNETSSSSTRSFNDVQLTFDVHNHTTITNEETPQNYKVKNFDYTQYGLLVIDEAHAFRNKDSIRYQETIKKIIAINPHLKILLLTATPVNNSLTDMENLIYLMTKGSRKSLVNNQLVDYKKILHSAVKYLNEDYPPKPEFHELLDSFLVSRDKAYVREIYSNTNIKFPEKGQAIPLGITTDNEESIAIREFYEKITNMDFASYNYFDYIKEERKTYYKKYNPNISERSQGMKVLMRMLLLKRYESTYISLSNTIDKMVIQMQEWLLIENGSNTKFLKNTIINDTKELLEESEVDGIEQLEFEVNRDDFKLEFFEAIQNDIKILQSIDKARVYKEMSDKKIEKLQSTLNEIIENNEKAIVFTTYSDTAEELSNKLRNEGINHGLVTGKRSLICINGENMKRINKHNDVLREFSPQSKKNPKVVYEFDILIATDVISEGQNLQDCSNIINFDVHWNPVRIIQRLGRIDRIGSKHNKINNYIFWPFEKLEEYLEMKLRLDRKNNYIAAVGAEGYEFESSYNTTKKDLELVAKGIDIENTDIQLQTSSKDLKKFEINYKRIKNEISPDNKFYEAIDYVSELRGISSYIFENEISKSCFLLYRTTSKTKTKNEIFPYILVELDENLKVKFNPISALEILKILYEKAQYRTFRQADNPVKKEFYRVELKAKLQEIPQRIKSKYDINDGELSLICSIYTLPSDENPYMPQKRNHKRNFMPESLEKLENYATDYMVKYPTKNEVQISDTKQNDYFDAK